MTRLVEWFVIGLIPALPAALCTSETSWLPTALAAMPVGFLFQQLARYRLEVSQRAFDGLQRPALALLREQLELGRESDPYQIYEVTFYRHPQWQAARDHVHRCWHWIVLLRAAAAASWVGMALLVLAVLGPQRYTFVATPSSGLVIAAGIGLLAGSALLLARKATHTEELLHRFDRAWVAAHWPAYAAVADELRSRTARHSFAPPETSTPANAP